uniref:Papain family cysteine protease n=1 Tax=Marseillevirus LCMAC102 TaxID=2506603 RepID=A0A481YSP0_9VIRU|nr:MAG: papain family cysteine protease [Marseillevirus LCMAC102]
MVANKTIQSPEDSRDWTAETIFSELNLPKTLDLRSKMKAPRNQKSRGTCAAFTGAAMKEYQEKTDVSYDNYMSPDFIYFHRETKPGSGMHGRNVMKILKEYGCAQEYMLPYAKSDRTDISKKVYTDAKNFKILSYARVYTIEGLKKALYKNGPCYISFPTYKHRPEFWRAEKDEQRIGGHAVCCVGYTKDSFILRNSWGKDWNRTGHVLYPFVEWGKHWEVWSAIDDQSAVPDPPPKLQLCLNKMCNLI